MKEKNRNRSTTMKKCSKQSVCASLALVGKMDQALGLWAEIGKRVHIQQTQAGYSPVEKLKAVYLTILAGGQGVTEVNTRVRSEPGVHKAFGIAQCAEQSTASRNLDRCTEQNVVEMRAALQQIYQQHGQGYRHAYERAYQILDIDMSGLLAGRQGEGVTKGYFSDAKNRRGRQFGRVLATLYNEVVVDRLYTGKRQLETCYQELVEAAEAVLELDAERRKQTFVRVDGGGGSDADINWTLQRGYQMMAKVKSWQRAKRLLRQVTTWYPDPRHPTRSLGWVEPPFDYLQPTRQWAMRETHADGRVYETVIVTNLPDTFCFAPQPPSQDPQQILSALMHLYDQRGGGVETANRNSKSGLGLHHRNKRRFAAQEMLLLLAQLAYNFLAWVHLHLACAQPSFQALGFLRLIRDVFHIPGSVWLNEQNELVQVQLSRDHLLAEKFIRAVASLPGLDDLRFSLRKI
jgi:hypothetical protein